MKRAVSRFLIKKIASIFDSIGFVLGIILMVLMISTLSAGVISRYVFNRPIFWTGEFSRIVLMWTVFVGAALAFRRNSPIDHISMDFFVSLLPSRFREITDKIVWGVTVFFCLAIIFVGIRFLVQTISLRTAALGISKGFIYIVLPIFAVMSLVFLLSVRLHR